MSRNDAPLRILPDRTLLVTTNHADFDALCIELSGFANIVNSLQQLHTFRISLWKLWHAASSGMTAQSVLDILRKYSQAPVPAKLSAEIRKEMGRFGTITLKTASDGTLLLSCSDSNIWRDLLQIERLRTWLTGYECHKGVYQNTIPAHSRGEIKQQLFHHGFPVIDTAGYNYGQTMQVAFRPGFQLRDYQNEAAQRFFHDGKMLHGSGVVVLPCGAGKTIVGLAVMALCQCETLILTTNATSIQQWKREIESKTSIPPEMIGEYSGQRKQVRPVTLATYQILTYRQNGDYAHLSLFQKRNWGLIIYDEVHLLPAPIFRMTANLQATRRLGLTATLIREDGKERDVLSLIGPIVYEQPWKQMEKAHWIAPLQCTQYCVPMEAMLRNKYNQASNRDKQRLACENPGKLSVLRALLRRHQPVPTLIIGQYVRQLKQIAEWIDAPLITGRTPQEEREQLYSRFRSGDIHILVVSKVANFAVDLPDAQVAIQVSGSFGSRQEEAQRVGRIVRPKQEGERAFFYTLVSADTREERDAIQRKTFLLERGYNYETCSIHELDDCDCLEGY